MGALSTWFAGKGLSVAEEAVKRVLRISSTASLIQERLGGIEDKLSAIIRAPYKQSLMHLKEGDLTMAKNKVIEAVSLDELDLPARLLYTHLLQLEKKYVLAAESYWSLLDDFGFRTEIVPSIITDAYLASFFDGALRQARLFVIERGGHGRPSLGGEGDDYYPRQIWCSRHHVVSLWVLRRSFAVRLKRLFLDYACEVRVDEWGGNVSRERSYRMSREVAMVTSSYLVVKDNEEQFSLFRLGDLEHPLRVLTYAEYRALFLPVREDAVERASLRIADFSALQELRFAGIVLRIGPYSRTRYEYMQLGMSPSGGGGGVVEKAKKVKGGTVRVVGEEICKEYPAVLDIE